MKNYKDRYPLNTFHGHTKRELITLIEDVVLKERETIAKNILDMQARGYLDKSILQRVYDWAKGVLSE